MPETIKPEPDNSNPDLLIENLVSFGYERDQAIWLIAPLGAFAPEPASFDFKAYSNVALLGTDTEEEKKQKIYTDLIRARIVNLHSGQEVEEVDIDNTPAEILASKRVTISIENHTAANTLLDQLDGE